MTLSKLSGSRRVIRASSVKLARAVIAKAVPSVLCECLEGRLLLATFSWDITWTGTTPTSAILTPGQFLGQIDVFLNTNSTETPNHSFTNTAGLDIIDSGNLANFTFIDRVPAAFKPDEGAPAIGGIKVVSDVGNATLRIEGTEEDRSYSVTSSTSTNSVIRTIDMALEEGHAQIGQGVTNLVIEPHPVASPTGHWPPSGSNLDPGNLVNVPHLDAGIELTVDTSTGTYDTVTLGSSSGFVTDSTVITGAGNDKVNVRGIDGDFSTALVDFGDGSGDGNNQLNVNLFSTVTLAQAPGSASHVVVVEDVNVGGAGDTKLATLIVADPASIDDLQLNNYGWALVLDEADGTTIPIFTVGGANPINSFASIEGESEIGTMTVNDTAQFLSTSSPTVVTEFDVTGTLSSSIGEVTIDDGADVLVLESSRIGNLRIPGTGLMTLQERDTDHRVLAVKTLFMGSDPSDPDGVLDLNDNAMVVDHSGTTPIADIQAMLTSGYDSGAWDGNGINTSLGTSNTFALGYAENDNSGGGVNFSTFEGYTVDGSAVLIRYGRYGDANLDGTVNSDDYNRLATNFGLSGKRWGHGDFNFDGSVNSDDFNLLSTNFGQSFFFGEIDWEDLLKRLENGEHPMM
jgi:hypothetical protein